MMDLAVVGLFEVLRSLWTFKSVFDGLLKEIDKRRPDLAILVDYPGFNLRLATELKKRQIPIIYYISPQVWAWGAGRIAAIRRLVTRMIVVFPFEEELYKRHGVPVSFVGHPLLDTVKPQRFREVFLKQCGLDTGKFTFALLPGSRSAEVKLLLPIMLNTAKLIYQKKKDAQFVILRSSTVSLDTFEAIRAKFDAPLALATDSTYDGLAGADFALVASGTATLETALMNVPMVILYKVSFLTWAYLKTAIKIPYIGLVNVVAQKKFIEEFIQYRARASRISGYILSVLNDKPRLQAIKAELKDTTRRLGPPGASARAAGIIMQYLR
jgi:lipid-A-disaccharide synthase